MTNPRQNTFQPMQKPVTIPLHWEFDKTSYDTLLAGFESKDMDDRWDVAFSDGALHFYRSWTGYQVYKVSFTQKEDKYIVTSFDIDEASKQGDDEQETEWFSLTLKHVMGVEPL